jgi:hypothetical protein
MEQYIFVRLGAIQRGGRMLKLTEQVATDRRIRSRQRLS